MGFLDRLLGRESRDPTPTRSAASTEDERALDRYRYLVRTAPPERIEQAHEEAFARLTPEQRRQALQQLTREVPDEPPRGDDPRSLARSATRAELRRPGTVERAFGPSMGAMGPGLLGSFATAFAGTLAAQALFADLADGELFDGPDNDNADNADAGDDAGDTGDAGDAGGDSGGGDFGGGDFGGGDFGGGDFGGGDF
jgi:hypothetical protein